MAGGHLSTSSSRGDFNAQLQRGTLRKKTEPKQCPLGTVLKNGALFSKKGTKTVPFWQSAPHLKGTVFQNSALRAPFSTKRLKMVPSWKKGHCFCCTKRSKMVPFWKRGTILVPLNKGHCFCCKKRSNMVPSCKGVLYQCPWGTIFVWKR